MATRNGNHVDVGPTGNARLVTWTGLLNGDDGAGVEWVDFMDRCIQVSGTFGAGGSVSIQGSNDGTTWATLNNAQGTALTLTAAGLKQVVELPRYVRPLVTAGDGTTNLTVTVMMRRMNRPL